MPGLAAELALPDPGQARRRFGKAARSFATASFVHDEARRRLIERLTAFSIEPGIVVDLGSAHGHSALTLARQYPEARIIALDSSIEMLGHSTAASYDRLAADIAQLPFPDRSIDLLFANLALPWVRPEALFAEARRVLKARGLLVFSTLGPDTLQELRRAWAQADDAVHIHAFWDVQTLGNLAVQAGLEEPVLDVDRLKVTYPELSGVIRDLRACGATNTAAGRRRGLTGRQRWQQFVAALWRDQGSGSQSRLGLTVELICGQAFGASGDRPPADRGEIVVPLDQIGRAGMRASP